MKKIDRKSILITISFLILAVISGYSQFSDPTGNNGPLNIAKKTIKENWHNCWPPALAKRDKKYTNRRLKFKAHLYHNCWYDEDALSYPGWNKIGTITYPLDQFPWPGNWDKEDRFKSHVGWRMKKINEEQVLRLSLFYHQDFKYVSHWIEDIFFNPDAVIWVDMYLGSDVIGLVIDDKCLGLRQMNNYGPFWDKKSLLRKIFWFGGKSPAPHKMEMKFECMEYDRPNYQDYFNSRNIMTWNLTEFQPGDNFVYFANTKINGSGEIDWVQKHSEHPDQTKQKCIIKDGANITFIAGQKIILHHGFCVKSGGNFVAKIGSREIYERLIGNDSINISTFSNNRIPSGILKLYDTITNKASSLYSGREFKSTKNYGNYLNINKEIYQIYPNPNSGIFNLVVFNDKFSVFSVQIINMIGKTVYKKESVPVGKTEINIKEQAKGIYFIKIQSGDKTYMEKVVYR